MDDKQVEKGLVLKVPYSDKDEAKSLGARWDAQLKKWFVPKGQDTKPFGKWIDNDSDVEFSDTSEDMV